MGLYVSIVDKGGEKVDATHVKSQGIRFHRELREGEAHAPPEEVQHTSQNAGSVYPLFVLRVMVTKRTLSQHFTPSLMHH